MKKAKIVCTVLVALCFICLSRKMTSDSSEQERLEYSISSVDSILFKSKRKGGEEITFDIRDDIKRGQEFLKDKTAGYSLVKEERKSPFLTRRAEKEKSWCEKKLSSRIFFSPLKT